VVVLCCAVHRADLFYPLYPHGQGPDPCRLPGYSTIGMCGESTDLCITSGSAARRSSADYAGLSSIIRVVRTAAIGIILSCFGPLLPSVCLTLDADLSVSGWDITMLMICDRLRVRMSTRSSRGLIRRGYFNSRSCDLVPVALICFVLCFALASMS